MDNSIRLMTVGSAPVAVSDATDTCEKCGAEVRVGEWPYCPHGYGTNTVRQDEIPGGLTIENLGPEPVTVYSHSERRRIMKERGLQEFVRHAPLPGSDKSPHTTRWI